MNALMIRTWHRRLWSSVAALAVLLNALVPALSQAQAASAAQASGWTEVCSASGSLWLRLDAQGQVLERSQTRPDDAPAGLHGSACGYCVVHAASFGLTPDELAWTLPDGTATEAPPAAPAWPAVRAAPWTRPAARAPPTLN